MRRVRIRHDLVVDLDKFDAFKYEGDPMGFFKIIGRNARNQEDVTIAKFQSRSEAQKFLFNLADTDLMGETI